MQIIVIYRVFEFASYSLRTYSFPTASINEDWSCVPVYDANKSESRGSRGLNSLRPLARLMRWHNRVRLMNF
jgi:hypothetical protein